MDYPCVCVIDHSQAVRETIAIVLGGEYQVQGLAPDEYLRDPSVLGQADLLIIADDALPLETIDSLSGGRPVLRLQRDGEASQLSPEGWAVLPRSFTPEDLRTRVREVLTQRHQARLLASPLSIIDYPLIPMEAMDLARHAARTGFPVLLCGEPGAGKARLARAIHTLRRDGRFVQVPATSCTRAALEQAGSIAPGNLTVFVNDLSALTTEGYALLLELLDCGGFASSLGWHGVRLTCATSETIEALARSMRLTKDLYYRLSVFPIMLPPLRDRPHDVAKLAAHVAKDVARALGTEPVTFSPRAVERLTRYLWFGNLAELETVLTRTVALTPHRPIEADDLLFGYGRITPRPADRRLQTAPAAHESRTDQTVDLIINELAHEFKNPMVTIKMVAQQLEQLLADAASREQVARMTSDAVDRMDRTLENLLEFGRFRGPSPRHTSVNAVLAPCLTDIAPQLTERQVTLNYLPAESSPVFVDPTQVAYAFDNLLRVIVRDLEEGASLSVSIGGAPAAVTFGFKATGHALAEKLSALLDHPKNGGGPPLPLGLVFAKTLIERNRGSVEIASGGSPITVRLPSREEVSSANGKTTGLDS